MLDKGHYPRAAGFGTMVGSPMPAASENLEAAARRALELAGGRVTLTAAGRRV